MSKLKANQIANRADPGSVVVSSNNRIVSTGGGSIYAPGTVIQLKRSIAGPAAQTISSATPVAVTGLSVTIAPYFANSLIVINAQISTNAPHVSSFGIFRNGAATVSTSGYTNSNEANMQCTTYVGTDVTTELWCWPVMHFETAGTTSNITYQVYATAAWAGTPRSLVINNRTTADMASFSHITVMEVAQ